MDENPYASPQTVDEVDSSDLVSQMRSLEHEYAERYMQLLYDVLMALYLPAGLAADIWMFTRQEAHAASTFIVPFLYIVVAAVRECLKTGADFPERMEELRREVRQEWQRSEPFKE